MIQDWKLTVVVAASPYVDCQLVDEELPTTYCVVSLLGNCFSAVGLFLFSPDPFCFREIDRIAIRDVL